MLHFPAEAEGVEDFLDDLPFLGLGRQFPDVDAGEYEEDGQPEHVHVLLPAVGGAGEGVPLENLLDLGDERGSLGAGLLEEISTLNGGLLVGSAPSTKKLSYSR